MPNISMNYILSAEAGESDKDEEEPSCRPKPDEEVEIIGKCNFFVIFNCNFLHFEFCLPDMPQSNQNQTMVYFLLQVLTKTSLRAEKSQRKQRKTKVTMSLSMSLAF